MEHIRQSHVIIINVWFSERRIPLFTIEYEVLNRLGSIQKQLINQLQQG